MKRVPRPNWLACKKKINVFVPKSKKVSLPTLFTSSPYPYLDYAQAPKEADNDNEYESEDATERDITFLSSVSTTNTSFPY